MFERLFKNPLTTLGGIGLGALQYVMTSSSSGFTWKSFAAASLTMLFGGISKDK